MDTTRTVQAVIVTDTHVMIGAVVLVVAGCYVAIRTVRLQRATKSPAV